MQMEKLITLVIALLLAACSNYEQELLVVDVTKSERIILKSKNKKYPYAISIRGSGHVNGNAEVLLMVNNKPYKTVSIAGKVDFYWRGDWYENEAIVQYNASDVTEGRLIIEYSFETL